MIAIYADLDVNIKSPNLTDEFKEFIGKIFIEFKHHILIMQFIFIEIF